MKIKTHSLNLSLELDFDFFFTNGCRRAAFEKIKQVETHKKYSSISLFLRHAFKFMLNR